MSYKNSRPYNRKGNRSPRKSWEVFILRHKRFVHWHTQGGFKGPFSKAMADAFVRRAKVSGEPTACVWNIYGFRGFVPKYFESPVDEIAAEEDKLCMKTLLEIASSSGVRKHMTT